jgi:hypothetical protein
MLLKCSKTIWRPVWPGPETLCLPKIQCRGRSKLVHKGLSLAVTDVKTLGSPYDDAEMKRILLFGLQGVKDYELVTRSGETDA